MKDPGEMTIAEYSALASSGQLPKPVPAVPTPEVLIDPATGQPYPADRQYPTINPATGQPYPTHPSNYPYPETGPVPIPG
jgi:hypothetical protein